MNWPVPSLELPAPIQREPHSMRLQRAVSISLVRFQKTEFTEKSETETAESFAQGENDDLLKRLMSVLQAPLFLDCGDVVEWPFPLLAYQQAGIATLMRQPATVAGRRHGAGQNGAGHRGHPPAFLEPTDPIGAVVCPSSVVRQWARELALWGRELTVVVVAGAFPRRALWRRPAHLWLVSYETLRSRRKPSGTFWCWTKPLESRIARLQCRRLASA